MASFTNCLCFSTSPNISKEVSDWVSHLVLTLNGDASFLISGSQLKSESPLPASHELPRSSPHASAGPSGPSVRPPAPPPLPAILDKDPLDLVPVEVPLPPGLQDALVVDLDRPEMAEIKEELLNALEADPAGPEILGIGAKGDGSHPEKMDDGQLDQKVGNI